MKKEKKPKQVAFSSSEVKFSVTSKKGSAKGRVAVNGDYITWYDAGKSVQCYKMDWTRFAQYMRNNGEKL